MNELTIKDYIDYEKLENSGAGTVELQSFLISRYFKIELEDVLKIDIGLLKDFSAEIELYFKSIERKDKIDIGKEIERIKSQVKVKKQITNRSEILDL